MSMETVRSILRILAVVTILIGDIGATVVGFLTLNAGGLRAMEAGGILAVGVYLLVVVWGVALYAFSPALARHIVR